MTLESTVGWVLVHSLWQAGLVAVALRVVTDRSPAVRARHGVAVGALATIPILALVTASRLMTYPERPSAGGLADRVGHAVPALPVVTSADAWLERATFAVAPVLEVLVFGWAVGVLILIARLARGWRVVTRVRRDGRRLALTCPGLDPRVPLLESPVLDVPAVVGVLHPAIVVPTSAVRVLAERQLSWIVAHEMAHVRRRDPAVNVSQLLLETVFFFNPAVWWISRRIRIEREYCCDDVAASTCGDAGEYLRALVSLERLRTRRVRVAVAATQGSLVARARRLTDPSLPTLRSPTRIALRAALLLGLLSAGVWTQLGTERAVHAAGRIDIRATDPAGEFTVSIVAGRVVETSLDGWRLPRDRFQQVGDTLWFKSSEGARTFAVRLRPSGGISWKARPAAAMGRAST